MSDQIYLDSHMHTSFSIDSEAPLQDMIQAAITGGLYGVAVTDHCEADEMHLESYNNIPSGSFAEAGNAKEQYIGKIKILTGIELGQPLYNQSAAERLLTNFNFDFVLCSLHNLQGVKDFCYLEYINKQETAELLKMYFHDLLDIARWNRFDSLAHLTYPLRYIIGDAGLKVNMEPFTDIIDDILKTLAQNGKALEVNTSGLRQKIGCTLPDVNYLRRFKQLGGEFITIGADAHRPQDVGAGLKEGVELLKQAGFSYYHYFEKQVPHAIKIK